MGSRPGDRIGIIYGEVEATTFRFAASDPDAKRMDYVTAQHPSGLALGQVTDVQRHSRLSFEEAVTLGRGGPLVSGDQVSCQVKIIGYRDERGLLQIPRTPFKAGTEVRKATGQVIQKVLGLTQDVDEGSYLGYLKGTDIPAVLDLETLVQKHASVLAKTGAGKSYTVGVLIEELLKKKVALVIVDPHGEYGTLANPNIEPQEIDNLIRFNLKPKSFASQLTEYALDTRLVVGARRLILDGNRLEATEILDLLAGKVSSAQQGLLYQAINELRRTTPAYTLKDIGEALARNPSNAKWPLIAALENLEATGLFSKAGTAVTEVVKAAHCTILNLKGAAPPLQDIVVARLCRSLFEARKRNLVPPFLMVVEEAHNFCPERGIAHAMSGAELRTIASEGRKFGFGLLIVSQRPAKVDKNVLSQCNTQIIMKVTNPNDLRAITASVEGLTGDAADEIQRLSTGVALVAGGLLANPILVEIRTRQTRHGGKSVSVLVDEEDEVAPPTRGEIVVSPSPVAPPAEAEPVAMEAPLIEEAAPEPPEPVFGEPYAPAPSPPEPEPVKVTAQRLEQVHREIEETERSHERDRRGPWQSGDAVLGAPAGPPPAAPLKAKPPRRFLGLFRKSAKPSPVAVASHVPPSPKLPRAPMKIAEPAHQVGPSFEGEDTVLVRVVERVSNVTMRTPREAVGRIKELARNVPTLTPEAYVRAYAHIGRTYCYPSNPECGPCPLLHSCRLGLQRLARAEVREGKWGRSAK